jgi:hypothetical protein
MRPLEQQILRRPERRPLAPRLPGPRVRAVRGPRINSGRDPSVPWAPAFAGVMVRVGQTCSIVRNGIVATVAPRRSNPIVRQRVGAGRRSRLRCRSIPRARSLVFATAAPMFAGPLPLPGPAVAGADEPRGCKGRPGQPAAAGRLGPGASGSGVTSRQPLWRYCSPALCLCRLHDLRAPRRSPGGHSFLRLAAPRRCAEGSTGRSSDHQADTSSASPPKPT